MIIDFRVPPPLREWIDLEEARTIWNQGYLRNYFRIYPGIEKAMVEATVNDLIESLAEGGVTKAVLQGEWGFGDYRKQNEAVHRMVQSYPHIFIAGFMCINPLEDDDMVTVVQSEVKERGFRGVNIQPFAYRLRADDKRFYPVYAKCQELGIPVTIHTSINFSANRSIDYGRPIYLDEIACDFPNLVIVANHGGWPWVTEMVAVAWKHRNIYIEIGAISPKYIGTPGTGWEPLLRYGNSILQNQILFATDGILPHKRCIEEMKALPLKPEVKRKWLGENAARILGLSKQEYIV